ncbi:MAG: glycosyltransferase family 32 protein [Candidatus Babeliales bacterium]
MICHPIDSNEYQKSCNRTPEDKKLFDFAHQNYQTYFLEAQGYTQAVRIPKIIHQIWVGPHQPPPQFKKWQQTWIALHPDWEYKLWTDTEVENLTLINKQYYDEEQNYGAKSDILRLELLHEFGGLYVDIDCECLCSFDMLHHLCDFYIGFFQVNFLRSSARVNNALMAACPHHPLITILLHKLALNQQKQSSAEIIERTGPSFITQALKEHVYSAEGINLLLPANFFYPFTGISQKLKLIMHPETMAIHYYAGTWHNKKKRTHTPLNKQSTSYKALQREREIKKTVLLANYNTVISQ